MQVDQLRTSSARTIIIKGPTTAKNVNIGILGEFWTPYRYPSNKNTLLSKKNLEDISPFHGVTDIPVLDFQWYLP